MKQRYTLIKNARLVNTFERKLDNCDILIRHSGEGGGNYVDAIERHIDRRSLTDCTLTLVNAKGNLVMPSFTDLAVTLREPGAMYKEDIASTCRAARAGGYRAFLAYFEPDLRFTTRDVLSYLAAFRGSIRPPFYPAVHVGESDLASLLDIGGTALTDRYAPFEEAGKLKTAMQRAAIRDMTLTVFPSIASLDGEGAVNASIAPAMRQKGLSPASEEIAVYRSLSLAEETDCRLHLSGVSTEKSLSLIRSAKAAGLNVTCDVSPFHFFFDESAILYHGNTAKLLPPLRKESDRMAVIEAIVDGTVDAIASHHQPNDQKETEKPLSTAPFGAASLETVFSATVEALLRPGYIDVFRLTELLASAPYTILAGCLGESDKALMPLEKGAPADLTIVSLDSSTEITAQRLKGRAKNTPFLGMTLSGRVLETISSDL